MVRTPCAALALAALLAAPQIASAQITGDVVRIGVLNDQSGIYADLSGQGSVWAARKAVEDFGASAKGLKVEVIAGDHQNKPDVGASIARRWFDTEGVDVIVDVPTSSVALAVNTITREKNKVFLASGPATDELTGKSCSPNTIHWTYDTWALAHGTGEAIVKTGGDTWFFITADYAFGHALESDTAAVVKQNGGKVLGAVRHPLGTQDFSSYLLQAQASGAKIIGLANAGGDTINSIKQASEFGITGPGRQQLAGLLIFITDVNALGLNIAQGLLLTSAWYWDANDANRAFAKEFAAANDGRKPTMVQAGVYSSVIHYLKSVAALKSDADGAKVVAHMKSMPTEDRLFGKGWIRPDGRKMHDMYLFEIKSPKESKYPWDYYKLRAEIPAERAFRPLSEGHCPLVAGSVGAAPGSK